MSGSKGLAYRPDIDALRAFAVLPVVLFHLGAEWLPGGFLGVDVFFVISGYLITSLLIRQFQSGRANLLAFWRRRILRILPALIVVVVATFAVGQVFLYAPERYLLSVNAAAALVSVGNITHWRNYGGYWSSDAEDSPLLHTWSLGVEEQFYLVYPLLLLVAWRYLRMPTWAVLVAGMLASAALYVHATQSTPAAAFYLFPTRAWELLAGAVVAFYNLHRTPGSRAGSWLAYGGLAMIVASYLASSESAQLPGSLVAVAGAAAVVGAGTPSAFARVALTARPIVMVGLISYSLYLWHWPVIVLGRAIAERYGTSVSAWLLFATSMALAWLSWRFVERPIRSMQGRRVPLALLAIAIFGACGLYANRDANTTEDTSHFRRPQWDGELYNVNPASEWSEHVRRRMQGVEVSPRPAARATAHREQGVLHGDRGKPLDVLVLGDSHGLMWAPAIRAAGREMGLSMAFMTADGTPVFFDPVNPVATRDGISFNRAQWTDFNRARARLITTRKPRLVVIAARWDAYSAGDAGPLLKAIERVGAKVLLVEDAPRFDIGDRNALQYLAYLRLVPGPTGDVWSKRVDMQALQASARVLREVLGLCPETCRVVATRDLYLDDARGLLIASKRVPTYVDDDHLSKSGALLAQGPIAKGITQSLVLSRIPENRSDSAQ